MSFMCNNFAGPSCGSSSCTLWQQNHFFHLHSSGDGVSHLFSVCVVNTLFTSRCRLLDSSNPPSPHTTTTTTLSCNTPVLHPTHRSPCPSLCVSLSSRSSVLYTLSFFKNFFLPRRHSSHFYMSCFWFFHIVCLSPVSRQWFYPMVGDIMLFYHRVEPRTGCWRVSASVRTSVSSCPPSINPLGDGGANGGVCRGPGEHLAVVLLLLVVVLGNDSV